MTRPAEETETEPARTPGAREDPGAAARPQARSEAIYRAGWHLCRLVFRTYFRARAAGEEHVPLEGPFILASNHASFMDPPLVGSFCGRPISYLARESLFAQPWFGWLLRKVGCVPVDRDGASGRGLKTILERLLAGDGIILFPEGTRSPTGELQRARAGVGLVVIKSTAPVVPVRVFGSFEAWGRRARFPRPRPVAVRFGEPLLFRETREEAARLPRSAVKELYQNVSDEIMAAIARLERP